MSGIAHPHGATWAWPHGGWWQKGAAPAAAACGPGARAGLLREGRGPYAACARVRYGRLCLSCFSHAAAGLVLPLVGGRWRRHAGTYRRRYMEGPSQIKQSRKAMLRSPYVRLARARRRRGRARWDYRGLVVRGATRRPQSQLGVSMMYRRCVSVGVFPWGPYVY